MHGTFVRNPDNTVSYIARGIPTSRKKEVRVCVECGEALVPMGAFMWCRGCDTMYIDTPSKKS